MKKMKRLLALILAMIMLLCGCGAKEAPSVQAPAKDAASVQTTAPAETTEETTEPITEPTTEPTEPEIFRNPMNGQIVDEPFTGRIHANIISNMRDNLPHVGVNQADVVFECYANMDNVVRCLAVYSDIESVDAIGSTRSTRPIFNDIAQHYSLILSHAGGSGTALRDANVRDIEHFNVEAWEVTKNVKTSYRDKEYKRSLENSLFAIGSGLKEYAQFMEMPMELERDYGFDFTEVGTPADGEAADIINLTFVYRKAKKDTTMIYDAELDKYVWNQYGQEMVDQITGEKEGFTNVIIMNTILSHSGIYHNADFVSGGTGYYANGGKIIPIVWACDDETSAFRFMTNSAEDLQIGVGNTYIAICTSDSPVTYESLTVEETVAVETEETAAE